MAANNCKIGISLDEPENCEDILFEKLSSCKKKFSQPLEMFLMTLYELGRDDSRRVIHAIKVGLALSVVSLFYLMEPLFDGVGDNAIWAIMTVVVVFEFTAGATLSKGLNRGIGTFIAGSLAISVGYIAEKAGKTGEPIIIGFACSIVGGTATFFRFFPKIKIKYDYGVLIFILTFNMITVSGYRVENIFSMAYQRLSTIAIGCAVSLVISLCICPIWAGDDLHRSTVNRIHELADSVKGCMVEYFKGSQYRGMNEGESENIVARYNDVLDSKASEESLANFASWEPGHGMFGFRHPWKQYVKIGGMLRNMAYCVVALHDCFQSNYQATHINPFTSKKPSYFKVGIEVAKILNELAESINCMRQCPPPQSMMESLLVAVQELHDSFCFQAKFLHAVQPVYRDQNNSTSLEASNVIHVNTTQQSTQAGGVPPEHDKPVIQIYENNGDVTNSTETNGKHDCNSKLLRVGLKEECGTVTKEKENDILMSIEVPPKCKVIYDLSEEVPLAAFASLVMEIVRRLERVIEAVQELGRLAGFKP